MILRLLLIAIFLSVGISCTLKAGGSQLNHASTYNETVTQQSLPSILDEGGELFIKEYTYNASEDDSKNSSRIKAIQQIKILLIVAADLQLSGGFFYFF